MISVREENSPLIGNGIISKVPGSAVTGNLSAAGPQSDLAAGGALWFYDLTVPDSSWILPVCLGLTNMLIVEVGMLSKYVVT